MNRGAGGLDRVTKAICRRPRGRRGWLWGLRSLLSACLCLSISIGSLAAEERPDSALVDAGVRLAEALDQQVSCADGEVRVGIWPIDDSAIPIPFANAARIYADVLATLIAEKPSCVAIIDGDGINATLEFLNVAGAFRTGDRSQRQAFDESLQSVDFYVAIAISERGNDVTAVLKIVDRRNGATIGTTPALVVPDSYVATSCGDGALPLDRLFDMAARALADDAPDLERVIVEGGYFRNTDARTEFTRYVGTMFVDAITRSYSDTLTSRRIQVIDPGQSTVSAVRLRGLRIAPRELADRVAQEDANPVTDGSSRNGSYRFSFRTWPCEGDERVKLVTRLQGSDGQTVTWAGAARLDSLPDGIDLHPPRELPETMWGPSNAISFEMTTPQGSNPILEPGDTLDVVFSLDADAWLYCFYTDARGETVQVLPNPFQADTPARNFFRGGLTHLFPDPSRDPFVLEITDDTVGSETVQCFALDRDATDDLPKQLRGVRMEPLEPRLRANLDGLFTSVPDAAVSSARMTITVLDTR